MMRSVEPPRRPRPGPRPLLPFPPAEDIPQHPVGPEPTAVAVDGDVIRAPGLAAFLRRNPKLVQRGAVGAIAAGVALFVVATATTSVASAGQARGKTAASHTAAQSPAGLGLSVDPAPVVIHVLEAKPTHAAKPAPVTHGVISGLARNGIPKVALNAYRVAAARMASVSPGCGIDWALLAGIGREESDHGRFGGAVLHGDGVSTPAIIGPALDGVHWDLIPAPANGQALDGDGKYAHALGPMQFIPSTWAVYGADATGDRKADVFNINDAALGAARYLCAAGGNLRNHAGQVRAVLAYNHSDEYLAQVLALADAYRRGVPISGLPVGITKGALPRVTDTGSIPPANPGAPTAVARSGGSTKAKPSASKSPKAGKTTSPAASSKAGSTTAASTGSATHPPTSSTPPRTSTTVSPPTSTSAPAPTKTCNPIEVLLGCKPS